MLHVKLACQTFPLSSVLALSFHSSRKNYTTSFTRLGGDWFNTYIHIIYIYIFSRISSLILHVSPIQPFLPFWRDWILCVFSQSLLSSFIALPRHTLRTGRMLNVKLFLHHPSWLSHSIVLGKLRNLIHSFGRELIYIYIYMYIYVYMLTLPPWTTFCILLCLQGRESRDLNEQVEKK